MADRTVLHGHLFEDFTLEREFHHHWGRTIELHDSTLLSTMTLNFNPLYFNREYARALGHPDIVINPQWVWLVISGMSVEDLSEAGGPFVGVDDMRFPAPTYPGDTLYATSTVVTARESKSRPGWGLVTWETVGRKQTGDIVIRYLRTNLSKMRDTNASHAEVGANR